MIANADDLSLHALETLEPRESQLMEELIPVLKALIEKPYLTGTTYRDTHAKGHAIVKANFTIEADLDEPYRVGLFKEPGTYETWIRFSNLNPTPQADIKPDLRAISLKLVNVPGKRLWQSDPSAGTLDLILMSYPGFLAPSLKVFYAMEKAILKGGPGLLWFFLTNWEVLSTIIGGQKKCASLLEIPYWSQTAYLFGDQVVKYHLRPTLKPISKIPSKPAPNFLREKLASQLEQHKEVQYDFMIQLRSDPDTMPIENANKVWNEKKTPFVKVATVSIPAQQFEDPEQMEFCENVSYNPWRTMPVHRPLGVINRTRHKIYPVISKFRHDRNVAKSFEPYEGLSFPTNRKTT